MNKKKTITIITPVFNEESCIDEFFSRIEKICKEKINNYNFILLFLNNASTDRSLEIIKNLKSSILKIKFITYSKNVGYQASLTGGLHNSKSDLYFIVDVDCEDPPEMLLDFINYYEEGFNIIYGKRVDRHEFYPIKLLRKIYYRLVHFISDHDFIVDSAEFSLFDEDVKEVILSNKSNSPFIRAELGFAGFNRKGIEYKRDLRIAGKSKYFITSPTFVIASIISTTSFPLRLVAYVNIIIFIFAILSFFSKAISLNLKFLLIIFMLELGIVSVYIARIYKNQIARKIFIIDKKNSNL